jgi:hypothetical protein
MTLQQFEFDVIVRQITAEHPSPGGPVRAIASPLFHVTCALPKVTEYLNNHNHYYGRNLQATA